MMRIIEGCLVPNAVELLDAAKREHAQAIRTAIVRARLKIMADEMFPANRLELFKAAA